MSLLSPHTILCLLAARQQPTRMRISTTRSFASGRFFVLRKIFWREDLLALKELLANKNKKNWINEGTPQTYVIKSEK